MNLPMTPLFRTILWSLLVVDTSIRIQVVVHASSSTVEPNWTALESTLSPDAALHGPFANTDVTYKPCTQLGTDAFAISKQNDGLCMHSHDCSHQFCLPAKFDSALPEYTLEAKVESDVVNLMKFALEHELTVSVKTTGHSYTGSSTEAGSLMIWMQNYEKDLTIKPLYENKCGDTHDVIAIGGGAVWDDVIEAVGSDYHVVTGGGRTVSAIGGWLQGGGLSFTSRKYGIGVDQILDMTIILPNGDVVNASACENSDLFWAVRGGGGGTFGVVTHAHYKLHPKTAITKLNYAVNAKDLSDYVKYWEGKGGIGETVHSFFEFWIETSPNIDIDWCGGFFGLTFTELIFCGSLEDALASSFYQQAVAWYDQLDKSAMVNWSANVAIQGFDSWYDYKGGSAAYQNPSATDPTGSAYAGVVNMSARLVPREVVINKPDELKNLLLQESVIAQLGYVNYFLGGNINTVSVEDSAVHPALRKSIWSIFTNDKVSGEMIREFLPNSETGVCFNHHNAWEPDWRNACWGSHYSRLSEIKALYDPNHVLNCWHCVGYVGDEYDGKVVTTSSAAGVGGTAIGNVIFMKRFAIALSMVLASSMNISF